MSGPPSHPSFVGLFLCGQSPTSSTLVGHTIPLCHFPVCLPDHSDHRHPRNAPLLPLPWDWVEAAGSLCVWESPSLHLQFRPPIFTSETQPCSLPAHRVRKSVRLHSPWGLTQVSVAPRLRWLAPSLLLLSFQISKVLRACWKLWGPTQCWTKAPIPVLAAKGFLLRTALNR